MAVLCWYHCAFRFFVAYWTFGRHVARILRQEHSNWATCWCSEPCCPLFSGERLWNGGCSPFRGCLPSPTGLSVHPFLTLTTFFVRRECLVQLKTRKFALYGVFNVCVTYSLRRDGKSPHRHCCASEGGWYGDSLVCFCFGRRGRESGEFVVLFGEVAAVNSSHVLCHQCPLATQIRRMHLSQHGLFLLLLAQCIREHRN